MNRNITYTPKKKPADYIVCRGGTSGSLAISTTEQPNPNQWLFKLYNINDDEENYIFLDTSTLLNLLDLIEHNGGDSVEATVNNFNIQIEADYYLPNPPDVLVTKKNPKTIKITPKRNFLSAFLGMSEPYEKFVLGEGIRFNFPYDKVDQVRDFFFYSGRKHHKKFHKEISYED